MQSVHVRAGYKKQDFLLIIFSESWAKLKFDGSDLHRSFLELPLHIDAKGILKSKDGVDSLWDYKNVVEYGRPMCAR